MLVYTLHKERAKICREDHAPVSTLNSFASHYVSNCIRNTVGYLYITFL